MGNELVIIVMSKYYLDSGLRYTATKEFKSDKEAWEQLRKLFGSKNVYVTLYKYMDIPINKPEFYVKSWNDVYSKKIKENATTQEDVVPIMWGLTQHKWGFATDNLTVKIEGSEVRDTEDGE